MRPGRIPFLFVKGLPEKKEWSTIKKENIQGKRLKDLKTIQKRRI